MKTIRLIIILLIINIPLFAQEEEESNPELEKYQKMQDSLEKIMQNFEKSTGNLAVDEPEFAVPKRNDKLLSSIPKETFTTEQLKKYVSSLMTKFEAIKVNSRYKDNVLKYFPPEKTKDYQDAAFIFWFKGGILESLYSILRAADGTDDWLAINNLSALLNIGGYPHKAIPMLKYLNEKYPKNKIVLNNIGQAYYELGEINEAYNYLTQCTNIDRYNVQANNTKGHIEQSRGNTAQAQQSYRNSVCGGYNTSAASNLNKLNPDVPIQDQIEVPTPDKYPPTDDNIPFSCPTPATEPSMVPEFEQEAQANSTEWDRLNDEYQKEASEYMKEDAMNLVGAIRSGAHVNIGKMIMPDKAGLMMGKSYAFTFEQYERFINELEAWKQDFDTRKAEALKDAGERCKDLSEEACCNIINSVHREYNLEASNHYREYCQKQWANVRGHYNVIAYWQPYLISRRGVTDRELVIARSLILGTASGLSSSSVYGISSYCIPSAEPKTANINVEFKDPKCRSINIPLGVGSIEMGCDKLKFSGGEVFVGEMELNFATSQVTIGVGVGFTAEAGVFSASQKNMAYVEFTTDVNSGNTNITDWGSKATGELTAGKILEPIGVNVVGMEGTVQSGWESGQSASGSVKGFDQTLFDGEVNLSN
ncbi:MAG: tetratricopeptide repeat protein [Ignavibacteriae bacterium]|nr:tetratricopeptide repeat protein [Ignavibacteriota bacterium]